MKSLKDILSKSKEEPMESDESMDSEGNLASDLFTALKEGDEEALVDIIKLVMDKCKGKLEDDEEEEPKKSALLIGLGK